MRVQHKTLWKLCLILISIQITTLVCVMYTRKLKTINYRKSNDQVKFHKQPVLGSKFEIKFDNWTILSENHDMKMDKLNSLSENEFHNNSHLAGIRVVKLHNRICNSTLSHVNLFTGETWQLVDKEKNMYVFSAYYVENRKSVFIIGARPQRQVKVTCQLWKSVEGENLFLLEETSGTIGAPTEGSGRKYMSTLFKCPLNSTKKPTHVSLVIKSCESPLNLLIVHNASLPSNYRRRFTVCLSPLNFQYGRAYELVEWIELNKALGANYFVVYNYSCQSNVDQVLEYYSKRNEAEVVQWRLPIGVDTFPKTGQTVEIHYFGQTAALNDCLLRNKQFSEFVVNLDVDEFIIPHSNETFDWSDIIKQLQKNAQVYLFKNTFFRKDWQRKDIQFANQQSAQKLRLVTLQVFEHEANILPAGQRSKYITRTADVDLMLTHTVPGVNSLTVPQTLGLLHHYRNWENPNDGQQRVTDTTVLQKYESILIKNVQNVWKDLVNVKMDLTVI